MDREPPCWKQHFSCNDCTKGAVRSNIPKGVLIVRSGHSALKYDLERVKQ